MTPRQVLGKYFEVYGQVNPITQEAGKKRLLFELASAAICAMWYLRGMLRGITLKFKGLPKLKLKTEHKIISVIQKYALKNM